MPNADRRTTAADRRTPDRFVRQPVQRRKALRERTAADASGRVGKQKDCATLQGVVQKNVRRLHDDAFQSPAFL